jgi:hypothetical protein
MPGKPDPPYNCSLFNYTPDSIDIQCAEGYDGGLPQLFHLEVYDEDSQSLLGNFSSATPAFQMTGEAICSFAWPRFPSLSLFFFPAV